MRRVGSDKPPRNSDITPPLRIGVGPVSRPLPVSQTVKQWGCTNPLRVCVFLAVECKSTRRFED